MTYREIVARQEAKARKARHRRYVMGVVAMAQAPLAIAGLIAFLSWEIAKELFQL